jgi:hypothetical protein
VHSLTVSIEDLAARDAAFLYPALQAGANGDPAENLGHFSIVGDQNGTIAIDRVSFESDPVVAGESATGKLVIYFTEALPDDRFTLTISDAIVDPAGNALDGDSNANQPNDGPDFPSGDGQPGGDFVARFTVDSRAELGVFANGSVYIDTNGNNLFDPEAMGSDDTNEDIVYKLGNQNDRVFAGNFAAGVAGVADGYDKLASYGLVAGAFRWLVDTNNNGVPDIVAAATPQLSGLPVAGNFDGNAVNGDEVGLKVGTTWYLDSTRDFVTNQVLVGNMVGLPFVGDFDGDGIDDLGAWSNDLFVLDLSADGIDGMTDVSFKFGFPGVREIPFAADFNGDGLDDIGLWQPDGTGVSPGEQAEYYVLMSQGTPKTLLSEAVFAGSDVVQTTQARKQVIADDFVSIDPAQDYVLSGQAMSGDGAGGLYDPANQQYFGFASYDIDQLRIDPWQVRKFGSAMDTVLAVDLNPGDTEVVLQDATGWANAGAAHQRSLAWYGYTDSQGNTYEDYTYTRNVAKDFVNGVWNAGGIVGNVITLNAPWAGPAISAGSAVRNATSGGIFNYAGLAGQAVPDVSTTYEAKLSGTGTGSTQFLPGTAFIKPIVVTNYQGNANNQITWSSIQVHAEKTGVPVIDRIVPTSDGSGGNEIAFTPQPFGQDLYATFGDSFGLPVVGNFDPPVVAASGSPVEPVRVVELGTTNLVNRYDVNRDGLVTALDALSIINYLNLDVSTSGESIMIESGSTVLNDGLMLNVNGDGFITALDALNVINHLNELDGIATNPELEPVEILPLPSPTDTGIPESDERGELARVIGDVAEGLLKVSQHSSNSRSQDRIDDVFSSWNLDEEKEGSSELVTDGAIDTDRVMLLG